ncbi:uncharacterized protein LOC127789661 [Diospyros lotus]|uniref:uncharacterized protein LOC127789661 n=1 Tax=Diospyros lotus TaxID=55363 RepID=UPI0022598636|nr:uncharacterized protein LOC127789661 [Diospyros lotus]
MDVPDVDLECGGGGHRRSSTAASDEESVCFSDADEGSCHSQFYSTADGSYDDFSCPGGSDPEAGGGADSRRASSASESDCSVDAGNGFHSVKVHLGTVERDCRICHLSLESSNPESGIAIELGCSCKDDLAAAHKNCAEAWFKIRGNKTCEICNSVARNVFGPVEIEPTQQTAVETNVGSAANAVSVPEAQSCLNGPRVVNFLLGCMVFAFVISWLFHFNIPS